jgi:hypothetical protein
MQNVNLNVQIPDDYGLAIVLIPPKKARLREPDSIDATAEETADDEAAA